MRTAKDVAGGVNSDNRVMPAVYGTRAARAEGCIAACLFGMLVLAGPAWGLPEGIAGYANAPGDRFPGERRHCGHCHEDPGPLEGEVFISFPFQDEIRVDESVSIDVTYEGTPPVRWGFNLVALDDETGEPVGELFAGQGSRILSTSPTGWDYLSHSLSGRTNEVDGEPGWRVDWRTPSDETESVTFYASFNAANGDGDEDGDNIFWTEVIVSVLPEPGASSGAVASLLILAALRRLRA